MRRLTAKWLVVLAMLTLLALFFREAIPTVHATPLDGGKVSLLAAQEEAAELDLGLVLLLVGLVAGGAAAAAGWLKWESRRTPLLYALIGLTSATGVIHLLLGLNGELLLLLNGLGYLVLLGVLVLPLPQLVGFRRPAGWILIGYTLVTIVGYFALHALGEIDLLGWGTKGIEVVLLAVLLLQQRSEPNLT